MPVNAMLAQEVWNRYEWLRDDGHRDFIDKNRRCQDFFAGDQWAQEDLAKLRLQGRPAMTINKILSTVNNVLGDQIFNRTDVAFRPRNGSASSSTADALTKVFMQIADNNDLAWLRSDVFCDGVIGSRGFYDVRMDFNDSLFGEVRIRKLNPNDVMIDSDAEEYDPDKWGDVLVTRWLSLDDIALMYSQKDANYLKGHAGEASDWFDYERDRFGGRSMWMYTTENGESTHIRSVRTLDWQYRKLDKIEHFVNIVTGDSRAVPTDWDHNRISAHLQANPDETTTKKLTSRIRWKVVAGNVVLHDDWSPYRHFTVVPYFPHLRAGRTVGVVENLLSPQEVLNKVVSQELHVVNTTANSGWKVKRNSLTNMTISELEQRGAETGLVLELDEVANAEKIQPNQVPTGLDRISYKADDNIKAISGVSDYARGEAREDVAAKSVVANQKAGQAGQAPIMDSLNRSDAILARNVLDLVQQYYVEERLIQITGDRITQETEEVTVNEVTPEGEILNDLTLGEYRVVITNQPERDTFEDSQFDHALRLKTEAGVGIPDRFLLESSRLKDKEKIIKAMEGDKESPEAQAQAALAQRAQEAEVSKTEAEVERMRSDAALKQAKAEESANASQGDQSEAEMRKVELDHALEVGKMEREFALKREMAEKEFALKRELALEDARFKQQQAAMAARVQTAQKATAEANNGAKA